MATLSTGANVVSGRGYDAIVEHMVDMETYAVMRGLPALRPAARCAARHLGRRPRPGQARRLERLSGHHRREAGRGGRPAGSGRRRRRARLERL